MKIRHALVATATATAALLAAPQAHALSFNLIDTGGAAVGTQARLGFEMAASYWSSVLKDNVTVNLNIGFQALAPGVLGSTGSARSLLSMQQTYNALAADRTSALDNQAVAGLQTLGVSALGPGFGAVTAVTNAINGTNNGYLDTATRVDNDGGVNNSTTAVTKASAKALGLTTDVNGNAINYASADAGVTFSSNFAFDFNPFDGVAGGKFDFIGVAIHEIGHALGFVSGVDSYDLRTGPNGPNRTSGLLENFVVMSQLDLFRYSAQNTLDWSTSAADKYFSLDGGLTELFGEASFSLGRFNGDGRQASHFKDAAGCAGQLGLMDPTICPATVGEITALDLAAFDAIGWNLDMDVLANANYNINTGDIYRAYLVNNELPLPASALLALAGLGIMGGVTRSRRRATETAAA